MSKWKKGEGKVAKESLETHWKSCLGVGMGEGKGERKVAGKVLFHIGKNLLGERKGKGRKKRRKG